MTAVRPSTRRRRPSSRWRCYSGIVKAGPDGTATVDFEIPAFNGTVRVMAVAWSKTKVGHAAKDVIVRDPVVIAGTLPRFLAVGDSVAAPPRLHQCRGAGRRLHGRHLDRRPPVDERHRQDPASSMSVPPAIARTVSIPVTGRAPGIASIVVTLKGPGDMLLDQDYALGIKPSNPLVTQRHHPAAAGNGGALTSTRTCWPRWCAARPRCRCRSTRCRNSMRRAW